MTIKLYYLLVLATFSAVAAESDQTAFFEQRVRPILAENCFKCHGPEEQKSGLRLDTPEAMFTGGSRGPAVEPGNKTSRLLEFIAYTGEVQMPPDGKLADDEIAALTQWIAEGATWPEYAAATAPRKTESGIDYEAGRQHWAYQPVVRHEPPAVQDASWPRNDLDRFILAKIEAAGLQPAPPADKRTLIRRVTFDLIGLPPTIEEVDAFLADESPDAYAKVVDRLLASPQYGERWARHWLDVVRYTDSFDSRASTVTDPVEIWRYRDWVVNAFNDDMPYDRFVRYQIAGDLLPAGEGGFNREGLIATGMLAIGNWPQGDADKEKMVTDIVDDQIDVITRGFMATTMACARCHDHKFDPFSIEDYYGLAGIFFSTSILPGPGAKTEGSPILHLPLASQEELQARRERDEQLAALRAERESLLLEERRAWAREQAGRTGEYLLAAAGEGEPAPDLHPEAVQRFAQLVGAGALPVLNTVTRDIANTPGLHSRQRDGGMPSSNLNTTAREAIYSTIRQPAQSLVVHPAPTTPVIVAWQSPIAGAVTLKGRLADADGTCGNGVQWTLELRNRGQRFPIAEGTIANGSDASFNSDGPVEVAAADLLVVTVAPNGEYACDSTTVELTIESAAGETWNVPRDVMDTFTESNPSADGYGNPAVWWIADGKETLQADPVLFAPWWAAMDEIAAGRRDRSALLSAAKLVQAAIDFAAREPEGALAEVYAAFTGESGPFWVTPLPPGEGSRRAAVERELATLEANPFPPLDLAVGIQEGGVPDTEHVGIHDVRVHRRGDYNNLGEAVARRMPTLFKDIESAPIDDTESGRRQLADFVASPENPLTARVMVNRVWLHHFGEGLVRTPGDFGAQGQPPTHPELLDYLADRFVDSGWSIKALHREMLLSATYQQASVENPAAVEKDPENIHFARMNRQRLEAEVLRDAMLAVSGRLDRTPGGPAFTDMATPRRTLYLRSVRSIRDTYATLFDAADTTASIPQRTESIVAPQALFLMNNAFVINEAKVLSENVASQIETPGQLVDLLYNRVFTRPPTETEREIGESALNDLGYPAQEAIAAYCQVLLSANEFTYVD